MTRLSMCTVVIITVLFVELGCSMRTSRSTESPASIATERVPDRVTTEPRRSNEPQRPQRPTLDKEPQIGVLLAQAADLSFDLVCSATVIVNGQSLRISSGPIIATATSRGVRIDRLPGVELGDHVVFICEKSRSNIAFSTSAIAPNGSTDDLRLMGNPEVHLDPASRKLQLVERIGMDRYLVSVLVKEMSSTWPMEALKAQAIVARSYAADRFLKNWDKPWQLHWHSSVDMAYPGYLTNPGLASEAVSATAGVIITYHGQPVPALFHACSGGHTASISDLKPDLRLADGSTDPAPAMPAVEDAAAQKGAQKLNLSHTHWQWSVVIPLSDVSAALQRWSQARSATRPDFGSVTGVATGEKCSDGRRVSTVSVSHRQDGRINKEVMNANDFRIAVGPGKIRSTWWTSCEVKKSNLLISGRGYGHGVGLSQVSAWQLAQSGEKATDIVRHFYTGATIFQSW